ncbi:MAG: glycosyltransferase family 2 protein [Acidobacteria bacterium]|jgi:glycosyltransferase involved in cell wall biosynthesis|nr:glycosyltransferase family 2 protein [Acidobacteriota bacterium]
MKLVIQICCYNEEESLPETLKALPKKLAGVDEIEILIIDDGSIDRTVKVAEANGVNHIISFKKNQGLARSFMAGLHASLKLGADIIVNTDADNQYNADDIPRLIQPILDGKADMVIGARPISRIKHFSPVKKILQKIGSWLVRKASRTNVLDAPSGYRAISRNSALKLNVFNAFTYTHETIIQAGQKNMVVVSIPIRVNEHASKRPSRLFKNTFSYIMRSVIAILRMVVVYRPFRFFLSLGLIFFLAGAFFGLRYLYFWLTGGGIGHVQSVILGGVLIGISFQMVLVAFLADLLGVNRKLLEEIQYRLRKQELKTETIERKESGISKLFSDF